jgi:isopentenyldiphosphate isomerase
MGIINDEDELLDLVDTNEQVVGTISHADAFDWSNLRGNYLRSVNAFIINSQGEVWIPKRTAHKKIAPNGLDYSVGEHTQAGESDIAAIVRGFAEELNMQVDANDLVYVGTTKPTPEGIPYFRANYLSHSETTPDYNPDDFVSAEWLKPADLLHQIETGVSAKETLTDDFKLVLAYLAEHDGDHERHQ